MSWGDVNRRRLDDIENSMAHQKVMLAKMMMKIEWIRTHGDDDTSVCSTSPDAQCSTFRSQRARQPGE